MTKKILKYKKMNLEWEIIYPNNFEVTKQEEEREREREITIFISGLNCNWDMRKPMYEKFGKELSNILGVPTVIFNTPGYVESLKFNRIDNLDPELYLKISKKLIKQLKKSYSKFNIASMSFGGWSNMRLNQFFPTNKHIFFSPITNKLMNIPSNKFSLKQLGERKFNKRIAKKIAKCEKNQLLSQEKDSLILYGEKDSTMYKKSIEGFIQKNKQNKKIVSRMINDADHGFRVSANLERNNDYDKKYLKVWEETMEIVRIWNKSLD